MEYLSKHFFWICKQSILLLLIRQIILLGIINMIKELLDRDILENQNKLKNKLILLLWKTFKAKKQLERSEVAKEVI